MSITILRCSNENCRLPAQMSVRISKGTKTCSECGHIEHLASEEKNFCFVHALEYLEERIKENKEFYEFYKGK